MHSSYVPRPSPDKTSRMALQRRRRPGARLERRLDQRHGRPGVLDRGDEVFVLAGYVALQVRHAADERVGEPSADERDGNPVRLALRLDGELVRLAPGIVEQDAHLRVRRPVRTLEAE